MVPSCPMVNLQYGIALAEIAVLKGLPRCDSLFYSAYERFQASLDIKPLSFAYITYSQVCDPCCCRSMATKQCQLTIVCLSLAIRCSGPTPRSRTTLESMRRLKACKSVLAMSTLPSSPTSISPMVLMRRTAHPWWRSLTGALLEPVDMPNSE